MDVVDDAALEARLRGLAPRQRALLEQRLRGRAVGQDEVRPRDPAEPLVLTPVQRRFWLLDHLLTGSAASNVPRAMRLRGELDAAALQQAVAALVARHEALRTRITLVEGVPRADVAPPPASLPLPLVEVVPRAGEPTEVALERLARAEVTRAFDLAEGPLLRAALLRIGPRDHVLLMVTHHVASDERSSALLAGELSRAYATLAGGGVWAEPAPALQYGDYAAWLQRQSDAGALETHLDHWRSHLTGAPEVVDLPTDRPRFAQARRRGGRLTGTLPDQLASSLDDFCRTQAATTFHVLLTAFAVLLRRLSGQDDFVVGVPVGGRSRDELQSVVGCFTNTLALRMDTAGDPTFAEQVSRVRRTAVEGLAHQDAPFDAVVEALQVRRDLSHTPVFQVCFNHVVGGRRQSLLGLAVEHLDIDPQTAKFDLTLVTREVDGQVQLLWEYDSDLFDEDTVADWGRAYEMLLRGLLGDASTPVTAAALLEPDALARLASDSVHGRRPVPPVTVVDLFRRQVATGPGSVAVADDQDSLTYRELDVWSGRIAQRLAAVGIRPGQDRVAVCVDRSAAMVAALLGVLKSGAAYVPLDPGFPAARLGFMLEDSDARAVLTESALRDLTADHPCVLLLDDPDGEAPATATLDHAARPGDPAYVIYTSGSTGQPKGVVVAHLALTNFLLSMAREPGIRGDDTLVAVTTLSFDIAALELFLPLVAGARVVVASRATASDPSALAALVDRVEATVMQATPATWRMLLDSGWPGRPGLRVLCGGEALPPALAGQLLGGVAELWNMYGPTETTIWSSIARVEPGEPIRLGVAVDNTDLLVVDQRLEPVPVGVAGELVIGGVGLARGYWRREQLTAERFVAHPVLVGERVYRTGDLVRARRDGSLEFLGRIDHQVKVRGFRIELGEVEAALAALPGVRDVVVVVREDVAGDRRLVGYVVAEGVSGAELRRGVGARLPAYMVPSVVVVLAALPRTPNGKTDRAGLPVPDERVETGAPFVAARTPVEEVVAAMWCEVLGVSRVGVHDNFFELGGDSLRAVRLAVRLQESFADADVATCTVFDTATLGQLAERLTVMAGTDVPAAHRPTPHRTEARTSPPSFAQQRVWFLEQLEPSSPLYTVVVAAQVEGALEPGRLRRSLDSLVCRHEALRAVLVEQDGQVASRVQDPYPVPLQVLDLRTAGDGAAQQAEAAAVAAASTPFDLSAVPLLRALLVQLPDERATLVLTLHHAVADGVSCDLLLDELREHYDAGGVAPLPEAALQYGDFARWQRELLDGPLFGSELDFWRGYLKGAPPVLQLPTDRPRPATQSYRGARTEAFLDGALTSGLRRLARAENATLFTSLLAGYAALLARYSGQDDIVVGTSSSGRLHTQFEPVVGYFANTLPIRVDVSDDPSLRELLLRSRRATEHVYDHQDLPFDRLVDELDSERDLGRNPLFQVMLLMQPPRPQQRRLGSALLRPLSVDRGVSRFDLTVSVTELDEGLRLGVEFATDLFDRATVDELLIHLGRLLDAGLRQPDLPISRLNLLEADEAAHMLVGMTGPAEHPEESTLAALVERQAATRPAAVAVSGGGTSLTYAALDRAAARLARRLRALGVGPDVMVAVGLPRGPQLLVGLLGVLKAGGAYVPLEPTYPSDRLAFMVDDAEVAALVTTGDLLGVLPAVSVPTVLLEDLDRDPDGDDEPDGGTGRPAGATDLAYVIYTSGSTGRPKGVMVEHRGVLNLLAEMSHRPGLRAGEVMVGVTTPAFDLSVPDLWLPLVTGAQLVLATPEEAADGPALATLLDQVRADVMQATPATWRMLLDSGWPGRPGMRVVCGGEGYTSALARPLAERVGELWNFYGPTEATVWCTSAHLAAPTDPLPLGRALPNMQVFVADGAANPVPVGVAGELVIGGVGLARGYWRREQLTAERFVAHPVLVGERVYRTGDLVRARRDGSLEFLGRIDHQVKVRGFRIELGEVEAALAALPGVRDVVVVVREDVAGDRRLVGYVVAEGVSGAELRRGVGARLPAYMVPSVVVVLAALPRTPNGKTDRAGLPVPDERVETGAPFVAARTPVEEVVAAMWCEVLGVSRVGVHDNFFELGGHSLRVTQVLSRIRSTFGIQLPLREVYESATVEALAQVVAGRMLDESALGDDPELAALLAEIEDVDAS